MLYVVEVVVKDLGNALSFNKLVGRAAMTRPRSHLRVNRSLRYLDTVIPQATISFHPAVCALFDITGFSIILVS
jgi:hypothetical protein